MGKRHEEFKSKLSELLSQMDIDAQEIFLQYALDHVVPRLRGAKGQAAQPAQLAPAPGYCKNCKDYTIEEPLVTQPSQAVELSDEEAKELWLYEAGKSGYNTHELPARFLRAAIAAINAKESK